MILPSLARRGVLLSILSATSWLETAAGRYSGIAAIADAALDFSAEAMGIDLPPQQRHALVAVYGRLPAWPDTAATLEALATSGLRLAFLSNLGADMLPSNMRANGLDQWMDAPLSTDQVRAFKPSPHAYAVGSSVAAERSHREARARYARRDAILVPSTCRRTGHAIHERPAGWGWARAFGP